MANNQYVNKVALADGTTLIDLTPDDVTRAGVLSGLYFHLPTGERTTGTCTYDADTSDATVTAAEIITGKTAYKNGSKVTGTMPNIGTQAISLTDAATPVAIQAGYHDGSGTASISSPTLLAQNIKSGVEILGITGTYSGESISARVASATPKFTAQTILPGTGYDYLSEVDIAAITVVESDNSAGGKTVTIGAV